MNYFQEEDTICTITPYHCLWYFDFFLVCDEDLYTAFHLFLQIESENHCTSQMRGLIDEVSIKQSRIVALEDMKNRQDEELVQLKDLIQTFESALLSPVKLIFLLSFY
jgi:hypothetical protein